MNDWITWEGGAQPVADDVIVEAYDECGEFYRLEACALHWLHDRACDHIVKYRIAEEV